MWKSISGRVAAVVLASVATGTVLSGPAMAATLTTVAEKPPAAYILIDNDTGNVLADSNDHTPLPPASTTKLLTALVAVSHLKPDQQIPISAKAESMPAMKIGLLQNQQWSFNDLLHCLLMISANDAAVALAEASSGSLDQFAQARLQAAHELGLQDNPVFNDPAGLDDSSSNGGGDLVSARDMAIIARAALANPEIAPIVGLQHYSFLGGDGNQHSLTNHNKMLANYPGAIGVKTGYTEKADNTMVAAATRNGRTMLAVVLKAATPYGMATRLLDQGFATPVAAEPTTDHLALTSLQSQIVPAVTPVAPVSLTTKTDHRDLLIRLAGLAFITFFVGGLISTMRNRQVVVANLESLEATLESTIEPVVDPSLDSV